MWDDCKTGLLHFLLPHHIVTWPTDFIMLSFTCSAQGVCIYSLQDCHEFRFSLHDYHDNDSIVISVCTVGGMCHSHLSTLTTWFCAAVVATRCGSYSRNGIRNDVKGAWFLAQYHFCIFEYHNYRQYLYIVTPLAPLSPNYKHWQKYSPSDLCWTWKIRLQLLYSCCLELVTEHPYNEHFDTILCEFISMILINSASVWTRFNRFFLVSSMSFILGLILVFVSTVHTIFFNCSLCPNILYLSCHFDSYLTLSL